MKKIIVVILSILMSSPLAVLAVQTQINQVTDLFDEYIEDKDTLLQNMKKQNDNAMEQIKSRIHHDSIEGIDGAEKKANELNSIKETDLEMSGRQQRGSKEYQFYDENKLEPDYTKSGNRLHKLDSNDIVTSTEKTMRKLGTDLMKRLIEIGFNCKTVKGAIHKDPTYYIEIKREEQRNTEYDQFFCEEPRNQYSCTDSLTLKCRQFSEKPGELTLGQSTMQYNQNIQGLVRNISFVEQYGPIRRRFLGLFDIDQSSSHGGTTFFGLINKASGTTYHAQEANWSINFNISTNLAMIGRVQLTDVNYGTFVMFKLNGSVIFVGPVSGNNLFVNGHRSIESKGDRKYGGMVGRRTKITTNYPLVSTGTTQYALGLDSIASSSTVGVINLLPYVKHGDNILEIKAIGQGRNQVSFNLTASERICTDWQENWQEQCRLK